MKEEVKKALESVGEVYDSVVGIANEITCDYTKEIDDIIKNLSESVNTMSNEQLRLTMINLAIKSYNLTEVKEKSAFKAELSEIMRKEKFANLFNTAEGTVAVRENTATIGASEEFIVEELYNLCSQMFKTKQDEVHRVVDVIKTTLMSRMSEAKLTNIDTTVGEEF